MDYLKQKMRNKNKNRTFEFNRKVRKRTNYPQRLKFLKSGLIRIVIRKSNKHMLVAFVETTSGRDIVLCSAKSLELKKLGYTLACGNVVSAYLTGYLCAKKFLKMKKNADCIVDFGLAKVREGTRLFASVSAICDSGVKVRVDYKMFPKKERLMGKHLKIKNAKENREQILTKIEEVV